MTPAATQTATSSKRRAGRSAGAIVLILLCAIAAWYAYSTRTPRPANAADFRPDPGLRRGGFFGGGNAIRDAMATPRPRDPVSIGPRVVTVRDGEMTISGSLRSDANWNVYVSFNGESLGGTDAQRLMLAVRRTVDAKQPPANLKLTDPQRAALAVIPLTPPELSPDQLKQLTGLLNQSQRLTAGSPDMVPIRTALQALAAEVKAVDQNAVKAKYAERDAKFRSILSQEQIDTLMGTRANSAATATPPA